jgi:hypothetical protein
MAANTTVALSIVDAILKYGAAGTTLPATTLAPNCADVTLKCTMSEAKANTRASRHEQSLPSMFADSIDVSFPSDSGATDLIAFRSAFMASTPLAILVTDKSGMTPFNAILYVADFDDTQTLNEVPVDKFTLKPYAVGAGGTAGPGGNLPYFG